MSRYGLYLKEVAGRAAARSRPTIVKACAQDVGHTCQIKTLQLPNESPRGLSFNVQLLLRLLRA